MHDDQFLILLNQNRKHQIQQKNIRQTIFIGKPIVQTNVRNVRSMSIINHWVFPRHQQLVDNICLVFHHFHQHQHDQQRQQQQRIIIIVIIYKQFFFRHVNSTFVCFFFVFYLSVCSYLFERLQIRFEIIYVNTCLFLFFCIIDLVRIQVMNIYPLLFFRVHFFFFFF